MAEKIFPISEQYEEYLIDESKFGGYADSISFPESEEEVAEILRELSKEGIPVTIQGAKTGITGGSIPQGGHIMNLSHMNQIKDSTLNEDGTGAITVQPGINLIDLKKEIGARFRKNPLFWPPDPTETSASVGGIAATKAQGISRLLYGSSAQYIERIHLMDYKGNIIDIGTEEMTILASGQQMRTIDAVLGKEGITGIITELTLKLIPKPEELWGIAFFFEQSEEAGRFVDALKEELPQSEEAKIAAVEYIDRASLDLIEARKSTMTKIKELPDVREEIQAMVYIEIHGKEEGIEEVAEILMEQAAECESDPDEAWAVSGESDIDRLHAFRHGAAETANLFIEQKHREDKRITKLGTDLVAGNEQFADLLKKYNRGMKEAGLKGCIFGHALENHLHVNLLPRDYEDYEKGIGLIRKWAKEADEGAGKVIGEHGIGKLKRQILGDVIPPEYVHLCKELKARMDTEGRLNQGNIFK